MSGPSGAGSGSSGARSEGSGIASEGSGSESGASGAGSEGSRAESEGSDTEAEGSDAASEGSDAVSEVSDAVSGVSDAVSDCLHNCRARGLKGAASGAVRGYRWGVVRRLAYVLYGAGPDKPWFCSLPTLYRFQMSSDSSNGRTDAGSDDINDLKAKAGLRDLGRVTVEQFARVQKLAAEGELTLNQIKALVSALPQFVELQKETIEGIKQIVEGAKESQQAAIQAVSHSLNAASRTLEILAEKAETDETRLKLAEQSIEIGRLGIETANIIASMNKDNNNLWRMAVGAAGLVGAALIVVFSGGRISPPSA